jgi:hypothetical protein
VRIARILKLESATVLHQWQTSQPPQKHEKRRQDFAEVEARVAAQFKAELAPALALGQDNDQPDPIRRIFIARPGTCQRQ